ncbi:hypothetical protein LCGC14_2133610 [marine sediment metagenome]|uniref:Uncharacterized protein n=1 Tax=marine sediment metagenome TaxID=412755 RepID=A0A0F9GWP1_9ZZZZ
MDKLQEIKDEVIKVYPEVMELSFGCEVEIPRLSNLTFKGRVFKLKLGKTPHYKGVAYGSTYRNNENFSHESEVHFDDIVEKKILGKPITLEHILGVVRTDRVRLTTFISGGMAWFEEYQECNGFTHEQAWKSNGIRWILNKPLSEQPPETIDFIHSLIINKN